MIEQVVKHLMRFSYHKEARDLIKMAKWYEDQFDFDENEMVSRALAKVEIARHNGEWEEFVALQGEHEEYKKMDILSWLGY